MARSPKITQTQTTAQQLGSIVKSSRDIMRKDKGLSGDIDRLPVLTWIMGEIRQVLAGGGAGL